MNIGDRVLIGGRTMLRAGFSLVGLEGVLMPTFPNAPAGCATVQIDWESAGYDDSGQWGELPPFVNVPRAHLEIVAVSNSPVAPFTLKAADENARPLLGLVRDETMNDENVNDENVNDASVKEKRIVEDEVIDKADDSPAPRLRLV